MFRRKEESFDFESDDGSNPVTHTGMSDIPSGEQEDTRPVATAPAPSVAAAPRPASLAHAPGAAPRSPAAAPISAPVRPAAPSVAATSAMSSSASAPTPAAPRPAPPAAPASAAGAFSAPSSGSATNNVKTGGKRILTVGNDILLKGEIATCDRLVIEGEVDAKLNDVHTVEIAETGSFRGKAEIEDAEISGLFEGELVVRNRLTIYSTGKVRGKISYGEIEIERGGELTGEINIVGQASPRTSEKAA